MVTANAAITLPTRDPFVPSLALSNTISQMSAPPIPLKTAWIPLYFAEAKTVAAFISDKSSGILSPNGKINYDERSNQLWVKDDAKHLAQIHTMTAHLDQPGPQFLIKAKIINIDRQYQKKLGFIFRTDNNEPTVSSQLTMNEPNDNNSGDGEFTLTIAKLAENNLLNLQISALEQEGHASLISNPALITLNNQPATIQSGDEVPYQEATSSGATSVSFKKAVLRLKVTPQRMPDHHILLHIALNQDKVSALTVHGVPAIQTQQITTQVVVNNHQTIVLGGILETAHARQQESIPIMGDIPIVGVLFQHHEKLTTQQELLIFITPSMMRTYQ